MPAQTARIKVNLRIRGMDARLRAVLEIKTPAWAGVMRQVRRVNIAGLGFAVKDNTAAGYDQDEGPPMQRDLRIGLSAGPYAL